MSSAADHSTDNDDDGRASGAPPELDAENLLRQLPETMVRYDRSGRITFVNEQFVTRTGLAADDAIGRRPFEWADGGQSLIPDVDEYRALLHEVLETGEPRQLERVRPTPSGEPEVFQVLFRADRDKGGAIVGAFATARNITDLVRTRRELDAREQQFQALAENLPEVLIRFDTSGRVVYTNRQYRVQVGGPSILGRLVEELDPLGGSGSGFRAAVRRALTAGEPGHLRLATVSPEGRTPRTHSIRVQPEFDPDGSVSGAIAIGHDVTELDAARVAIARSEQRFRSLAEHLPDVVVRFDTECRATYVNRSLGFPGSRDPSELIGRTPTEFGGRLAGRLDEYESLLRRVVATGDTGSIMVSYPDHGGGERLVSALIVGERSDEGDVVGAIAIGRDVTDLVRAEREAEARAFEFRSLAENLPDMVIRYDLDARTTYVNRPPEVQLAGMASSMIGLTPSEYAPGGTAGVAEYERLLRAVIATGEPASIDITFVAADGLERVRSMLLRAERTTAGAIVGAIAIGRDVTDRVRAERDAADRAQEFRTLAENLPDLVVRYDLDARATYLNREIQGVVSAEGTLGLTPLQSSPAGVQGIEGYEATLRHVLATGEPAATDLTFVDAGGDERVHSVLFRAERSGAGDIVGAIAIGRDVTEIVHARYEIAARERQFRSLAENLPDLLVRYDLDARATYVNPQVATMLAHRMPGLLGRTPTEAAPDWPGAADHQRDIERVIATGESKRTDQVITLANGENAIFSVLLHAERDADGAIGGVISIGRDVTDLVRAEEAAAERAREFHTLAENLPDVVLRYDLEGRTVYVNPQHDDQVNMPRSALLGRRPTEIPFAGMTGVEAYEHTLMHVISTGQPAQSEIELIDRSGEKRVHNVLFRAERSASGQIVGAIAIGRDVTDLVRAEEAADARAREFHTLAENLPDVLLRFDTDARLVYGNRRVDLPDGKPISELVGLTPTDGAPGSDGPQPKFEAALRHVIATGEPTALEVEFDDSAGDHRVHNVLMHPERSSTGEIISVVAIGRDVTDLVRAERASEARAREFRSLAENLPDLVIRYDLSARATYANQVLPFPNGPSTVSDLIGRTPIELGTTDLKGLEAYDCTLRQVLTTGRSATTELVFTDVAHEDHIRSVVLAPERDSDGVIVGAISIGRDVTDLVQAQQRAAAREREFRTLAENATDFIGRWDLETRRLYTNPALARLMGKSTDELTGQLATGGPDGVFADFVASIRETIERQTERTVHQRFVGADGEERIHEVKLLPEFDETGQFVSVLGVGRDITEVVRQREALEEAARTDALTGVASRKVLYEALPSLLAKRTVEGRRVAVLLLDLDGFKTINDQHGHRVGDQMLRQIAGRLSMCLGPDDMLVRVGGDEFVLVLGDAQGPTDASVLAHQARMLVANLEAEGPVRFPAVDASVGIAMFPDHGDDTDALVAHADLALYEAKRAGRGRVRFFHAELRAAMERRAAIEQALYECVPDIEMAIHLQPICTLGTDPHVWGAEALLRWTHPKLGSVGPDEFIPIAEHSGQIVPIGRWVLRRAAEMAVELNAGRSRPLRVSVNVSTRQFTLDDVAEATRSVLDATGCDPRWLILEITENLLLEDLPLVHRTLDSLRSLGVAIAIDDFGTGYSSLHYLTRLRIDHMKVDKSFVRNADVDHQQQEIVRALMAMAQALGIGVVAEGIETPGQAGLLEQLGCRLGQGYLLARPMPFDQFTTWLANAPTTLRAALPA